MSLGRLLALIGSTAQLAAMYSECITVTVTVTPSKGSLIGVIGADARSGRTK